MLNFNSPVQRPSLCPFIVGPWIYNSHKEISVSPVAISPVSDAKKIFFELLSYVKQIEYITGLFKIRFPKKKASSANLTLLDKIVLTMSLWIYTQELCHLYLLTYNTSVSCGIS